ncbi:MAG: endonuclease/exonuclease/phosphatase family protein [Pseudorhizobium sp.]
MRILSLNAWGGRLHAPLIDYLREADPDVLCLQEVTRTTGRTDGWLLYRDGPLELPQRANLFADLQAALPDHDAFFAPVARGELFDGDEALPSQFGLATFVRSTHPVVGQALSFVHGIYSPDGWGPHPRSRNAHCIRIYSAESRRFFTIAQMHGLRDVSGKQDTPARIAQAHALAKLIDQVRQPDDGLIVCGDFNVLPDSQTFEILVSLGLTDLVVGGGFTDTRTSWYGKPGRYADYLLVDATVAVRDFNVVAEPEVSDHRALLLDLA